MNIAEFQEMTKHQVIDLMTAFIDEYDCADYTHEDVTEAWRDW